MSARLTLDFKDPSYLTRLKTVAAQEHKSLREVVMAALDAYFSDYLENRAIGKLAEKSFEEWDNPLDAEYDKL
jgi:hypothetical protein